MAFFDWNDGMSVGAPLIDSDHRALIAIINELHGMQEGPVDHNGTARLLKDLVTYTQYHFSREESMMQACHFPNLRDHAKEHGGFTQFIYDMRGRLTKGIDRAGLEEVLEYLKAWLNHHILVQDAAYKPYLQGNAEAEKAGDRFGPGLAVVRGDEEPVEAASC